MEDNMRLAALIVITLAFAPTLATPASADPYRWCADYSGGRGGSTNCYFMTYQQCRAAISGNGGFCRENGFFDGRPVRTPEDGPRRPRARS
jgi:hypothetical protein